MQQELRLATFNTFNLAPPGARLYDNLAPTTAAEYEAKLDWTARQIDLLDADLIGFQEIFSQQVLQEVLRRTQRYRDATHVGFDPDPQATRLTPSVALVSRLPLAGPARALTHFPAQVALTDGSRDAGRFTRAPLHASVTVAPGLTVDVIVVHLKSRRPDYQTGDNSSDPHLYALACLRSLIRRGTEATALRVLVTEMARQHARPRIVMGDFNDVVDSVTTEIVLGEGAPSNARMYDASQVQRQVDHQRQVGYSILSDGRHSTIDHILVSPEFVGTLPGAVGEVLEVAYINDHLQLGPAQASDHGQVLARIGLFAPD